MTNKKGRTSRHSPKQSSINNISKRAQCRRIADYMIEHLNGSSIDLQVSCNALHPPRRIFELRNEYGWIIETHWKRANDSQGRPHRVGNYVLKKIGVMP